jgi:molybdopterin-containing oxidoreductase family iron-sulfur binding subunit
MDNKRRKILKLAALSAAVGFTGLPIEGLASYLPKIGKYVKSDKEKKAKQWGMVIDTRKFKTKEDFERVIKACHSIHNIPEDIPNKKQEIKWIWEEEFKHVFPDQENPFLAERYEHKEVLVLCNHCQHPPCVRVCPTKATFKRDDGIVMMDFHRCIGCRYCMAACPYGSRSFNFRDPAPFVEHKNPDFPTRMRGVVEKCLFCYERLEEGKLPACVEASNGAIIFGDLMDPNSEIRKVLRENYTIVRKPDLGTEPCVFYII